ncbi:cell division control protein 48 homolog C-like [Salvia splendens]|uniref:cell division control protein 48 homolog C-like n=1 Tax=Salvia splendens TaxID=180675 RepID=UPI001C258771|nr:cell division control protein 48 homolog C-like [Salvia splendens]
MTREKGSAAVALRRHIESVSSGKENLTDEQVVGLLCSLHRLTYCRLDRNLLTERVAKITQLQRRRAGVISQDPAPFSARRQKINEPAPFSAKRKKINEVSGSPLEKGDCSINPKTIWNLGRSDELGHGRGEMNMNGGRSESESEKHSRPIFRDFLGITSVIDELKQEVVRPLHQLKLLRHLGVEPTSRILLHGPPKCGKTMLARAVANEARLPLFEISVARLMRGDLGAAEEKIRRLFLTAYIRAPSVVFIDEIDAMTSVKKRTLKEVEYRIVDQLMAFMDGRDRPTGPVNDDVSFESSNSTPGYVLVIGATNRPDALDTALRRLFDREFALGVPDECERFDILSALTRNLKVEVGFDPRKLARSTMGYVAGDLVALAKKAGMLAVHSIMGKRNSEYLKEPRHMVEHEECYTRPFYDEELENLSITMKHFVQAGKMVQPSAIMKDFFTTLHAKWDDVGGLEALKSEFERHVVKAIKYPRVYEDIKTSVLSSFLLCGPSGCGKTLLVKAVAKEAGANFMHIKARDLLKFGDQCEMVVHNIFSYASTHIPCVLFFDELDVMPSRDDVPRWPDFRKLISELSDTELTMEGVLVFGATNRPEIVSHSSLIKTQFDRLLYVPLPTPEERGAILKALTRCKPIDPEVDLMALGNDVACENFSGRDLFALVTEASKFAINRPALSVGNRMTIKDADFESALAKVSPSLSATEVKKWELQSKKIVVHSISVD